MKSINLLTFLPFLALVRHGTAFSQSNSWDGSPWISKAILDINGMVENECASRRSFGNKMAFFMTLMSPQLASASNNCMAECLKECRAIAPKVSITA